tara:strand:- start:200 stop:1174 length:975 start_codon:yes stop_codon:yes gene_type:complete
MSLPPSRRLDFSEVPILDIGPLISRNYETSLINDLYKACANIGFFYIQNHNVPASLISSLKSATETFFSSPIDEKMCLGIDQRIRGYYAENRSHSVENLIKGEDRGGLSHKEGFWVGHERPLCSKALLHGPNQWPINHPELKHYMLEYFEATEELANVLLRGFALALELDECVFDSFFQKPMTSLLLNHFPPQENPTVYDEIGLVPHSDAGGFTILWQDNIGGLEIQNRSGEWVSAPPIDNTFVINIGNVMQMWTHGRFSSTPHRVINRGTRDRYSIPLFVNPSYDVEVKPLVDIETRYSDTFTFGPYQRDVWRQTFPTAKIPN